MPTWSKLLPVITTLPSTPAATSPAVRAKIVKAPWRTELLELESVRVPVRVTPLAVSKAVRLTPLPVVVTPRTEMTPEVEVTCEAPETPPPPKETPRRTTPAAPLSVLLTVMPSELVTKAELRVEALR